MLIPLRFHVWMFHGCSLDTQDLRRAIGMLIDFVWMMPVVSLKDATVVVKGEDGGEGEATIVRITVPNLELSFFFDKNQSCANMQHYEFTKMFFVGKKTKVGIPVSMRIFLMLTIFLPRFLIQKRVVVGCPRVTSLKPDGFCLPRNALDFCLLGLLMPR